MIAFLDQRPPESTTMRSAMRTVEKRCEMSRPSCLRSVRRKRSKTSSSLLGVEGGGGLVEDEQLGVAQIGAGEGDLLPLAAGELDAALEAAAEHLVVAVFASLATTVSARLLSAASSISASCAALDAADGDVFAAVIS
jgi:hypothetical protein